MSVEEARRDVTEAECAGSCGVTLGIPPHTFHSDFCPVSRALDRLILEVQAAMPCSNEWRMELQFDDCFDFHRVHGDEPEEWNRSAYDWCPSCQARQKLAAP